METINDGITDGRETARMKCHLLVDKRHGNLVARHIFARAVPARGRDCLVDLHTQQTSNNQLVCLYRTTAVPRENKRIPNDTSLSMHSFSSTPPFLSLSLSLSRHAFIGTRNNPFDDHILYKCTSGAFCRTFVQFRIFL